MMEKSISVVMTSYNGSSYIEKQLMSIIPFLDSSDELIISDDGSTDGTLDIIRRYCNKYDNIMLVSGPQNGVVKNFESVLGLAKNDVIMFADQDDIWHPDKLPTIRDIFMKDRNIDLVLHDMYIATNDQIDKNEEGVRSFQIRKRKHGFIYNLIYSGYYGCCMCFTKEFKAQILPFATHTIMYDQWIGLIAEYKGNVLFLDKPLITHRAHGQNMGQKQTILQMIVNRIKLLEALFEYKNRKGHIK